MTTILASLARRFTTAPDPIDEQLQQLSKQGAGMARAAHFFATLLVVLFSAGSFVALGSDALHAVLVQWQQSHTLDIPSAISLCVSTLMVLAMDVAMLAAAAQLRLLASRRAGAGEMALHVAVMAGVAALESGTYLYMSWTYERPTTTAAGALIIARSLAAPLLAVYLASRRVLPITSRDILAASEVAAGAGVLRDVTSAARDQSAPLARKMKLYGAAAVMSAHDKARLDRMVDAVTEDSTPTLALAASESHPRTLYDGSQSPELPTNADTRLALLEAPESPLSDPAGPYDRPPTGPGTPAAGGRRPPNRKQGSSKRPSVVPIGRRRKVAATAEERVRAIWRTGMSISAIADAADVSRSTAHKYKALLETEASQQIAK